MLADFKLSALNQNNPIGLIAFPYNLLVHYRGFLLKEVVELEQTAPGPVAEVGQ